LKGIFEKLKLFSQKIETGAVYAEELLKQKVYLVSKIVHICDEKIQIALLELEENPIANADDIKTQLFNYLLENSLKFLDANNKNNKIDFSKMIYDNNFFNILKFTIENYDKKFNFFEDFINAAFDYLLNSNSFKEKNEKKINKIKEYLQLFWYFNTYVKGKYNEEVSEILLNKIAKSKNLLMIKNILKIVIDNLFEVILLFYLLALLNFYFLNKIIGLSLLIMILEI
jgi:hypothetical protein